ncbi:MAG: recombinase family protein, partial [Solobacterium sp.]|nr:recombinase family protein [Solobacterium sp.]
LQALDDLEELDINVVSITENFDHTPQGELMRNIIMAMDQYYSKELAQKIKDGKKASAEKGQVLGGQGTFGYKIENKKFLIDPYTSSIVEEIYRRYAYENVSLTEIKDWLNETGVKTVLGNAFNLHAVERILSNVRYTGEYTYKGESYGKLLPQIIDDELFSYMK